MRTTVDYWIPIAAMPLPTMAQVPGEYRVENGKLDVGTFTGWRLFHSSCHGWHGVDALGLKGSGTDVAPIFLTE